MGAGAVAGHGATIAVELDPVGAAGVFTTIAELNGDISRPEASRPETDVTAHQDFIDFWILGARTRGQLTGSVNYIYNDGTHDHLTGLEKLQIDNTICGFRVRGPNGTDNVDEYIGSGQVQKFGPVKYPVRSGAVTAEFAIRLSGLYKRDGVIIGNS